MSEQTREQEGIKWSPNVKESCLKGNLMQCNEVPVVPRLQQLLVALFLCLCQLQIHLSHLHLL